MCSVCSIWISALLMELLAILTPTSSQKFLHTYFMRIFCHLSVKKLRCNPSQWTTSLVSLASAAACMEIRCRRFKSAGAHNHKQRRHFDNNEGRRRVSPWLISKLMPLSSRRLEWDYLLAAETFADLKWVSPEKKPASSARHEDLLTGATHSIMPGESFSNNVFACRNKKNAAADRFAANAAVIIIIIIARGCSAVSALNQQTGGKHSESPRASWLFTHVPQQHVKLMLHRISSIAEII